MGLHLYSSMYLQNVQKDSFAVEDSSFLGCDAESFGV